MRGVIVVRTDPAQLAKLALVNRLFVQGWTLEDKLKNFDANREYIALAITDGKPVGVCYCCSVGFISTFVRKAHRRRGIGTELAKAVRAMYEFDSPEWPIEGGYGITGSHLFWESLQIPCA